MYSLIKELPKIENYYELDELTPQMLSSVVDLVIVNKSALKSYYTLKALLKVFGKKFSIYYHHHPTMGLFGFDIMFDEYDSVPLEGISVMCNSTAFRTKTFVLKLDNFNKTVSEQLIGIPGCHIAINLPKELTPVNFKDVVKWVQDLQAKLNNPSVEQN